ncbi:hypothetical protein D3C81_2232920 [compost metagenome]
MQRIGVGQGIGACAGNAVAIGITVVAEVVAEHGEGVGAVEVGVAQIAQAGQCRVDVGQVAGQCQAGGIGAYDGDTGHCRTE